MSKKEFKDILDVGYSKKAVKILREHSVLLVTLVCLANGFVILSFTIDLIVLFFWPLCCLSFMDSDYPFGIFKLLLRNCMSGQFGFFPIPHCVFI
jgi:hypothetical protein